MSHSKYLRWATGLLLLASIILPCFAINIPKPTSAFYVNDFAELLSPETESYLVSVNEELIGKTGAQVVVVTLPSLNGESIEEFSTELFRQYGIGSREKNNGVLLLLALEEREFRIEVGYGLEGALTDGTTGWIQDTYIIPYFVEGDWDAGIRNGFDAVIEEIKAEYGVEMDAAAPQAASRTHTGEEEKDYTWPCMIMMGFSAVMAAIFGKLVSKPLLPTLGILAVSLVILASQMSVGWAILGFIGCCVFAVIGWAITSPDDGSYSGSSGYSGSSYRSSSHSSHSSYHSSSSHSSHHSGGGGRSGGGGSTRKF